MKSREIGNINEALFVLRHFIDLSAQLLPFLYELENKHDLSLIEKQKKLKICEIYEQHEIDANTSVVLINSNVLELIKTSFQSILHDKRVHRFKNLKKFLKEYDRLKNNWNSIEAN